MTRFRSRRAALTVAVVLPLALAGCGGSGGPEATPAPPTSTTSSGAPATPATPTPTPRDTRDLATSPPTARPAPRPAPRACYRLDIETAVAPTSTAPAVPCTRPHTSVTYAVGTLDTVVGGHLLAVDSRRVRAQPARACPPLLAPFLGGTVDDLRLSMLRAVWFTPTVEESDAGAEWFRCDVIALAGQDRLAPLGGAGAGAGVGAMAGLLDRPEAERLAMCGTAEPGRPDFARVTCASTHSWRAVRVIPLAATSGDDGAYPGEGVARDAGRVTCKDVGERAANDKLNFSWGYEWPSAEQWSAGQTYGRCWIPD